MSGTQVSSGEMKRRLNDEQRREIDAHLTAGRGTALYADERGHPALIVTFGTRDSDLPYQHPPSHYGRGELLQYVPRPGGVRPLVSPALMNRDEIPQIAAPRRSSSQTEYPSVQIEMRQGPHPRGNSKNGYIDAQRLLPGREPEPQQPPEQPLTPAAQWWRNQVGGQ